MGARFRDRWFLLLASVVLLGVAGAGFYFLRPSGAVKMAVVAPKPEPVAVEQTATEISLTGTIQARNLIPVAAPIDGTIEALEVDDLTEVSEGQLLARIKNEGLQTAHDQAAQELEQMQGRIQNLESALINARLEASRALADSQRAQAEFDKADKFAMRQQLLYKEGATARLVYEKSQKDLELAMSERNSLREMSKNADDRIQFLSRDIESAKRKLEERSAALEDAKTDLLAATVNSPVDGLLLFAKAKVGERVSMDRKDLFTIAVAPEELEIPLDLDAKTAERVTEGMAALVQIVELSQDAIEGEITKDEDGKFHVEFQAADPVVRPGLTAIIKIKLP